VTPQVQVGQYRIDMVVEGHNDTRLAIECDGDKYHGADKWADDMQRQRILERAGWEFWRCFASAFTRRRQEMLNDLLKTLAERGIDPIGAEGAPMSVHTEHRVVNSASFSSEIIYPKPIEIIEKSQKEIPSNLSLPFNEENSEKITENARANIEEENISDQRPISSPEIIISRTSDLKVRDYLEYAGPPGSDPRTANKTIVSDGIFRIVEIEGPVVAKRVYDTYLRSCGIRRMGKDLKSLMNKALAYAIQQGRLVSVDELDKGGLLYSVVRVKDSPPISLRTRGQRTFDEIPPSELNAVARYLAECHGLLVGSEEHMRAILELFDLKRLTVQVDMTLREIITKEIPYVNDFLNEIYN